MNSIFFYLSVCCFLFLKAITAAKVYMIDFPNAEDTALLYNYDDYDPINGFLDYDEDLAVPSFPELLKTHQKEKLFRISQIKQNDETKPDCKRIYGSMYGKHNNKCKDNPRRNAKENSEKTRKTPNFFGFKMMNRFSQDYLDVNDLNRAERLGQVVQKYVHVLRPLKFSSRFIDIYR